MLAHRIHNLAPEPIYIHERELCMGNSILSHCSYRLPTAEGARLLGS